MSSSKFSSPLSHVVVEIVDLPDVCCRLMVICMDHQTSSVVNIIGEEMGLSLARAVLTAEWYVRNELINAVVLCSGKQHTFLAGADILYELKLTSKELGFSAPQRLSSVFCRLEALDVPTIAVVNGAALGGGLELILCFDYCVADAVHCTQLGLPEVKLGVLPGGGGCIRLPQKIGLSSALDLLLTGKHINAKKAMKCGLVDQLFTATDSVKTSSGHYQHEWLPEITACLRKGRVGKKQFTLKSIKKDGLVQAQKVPDFSHITADSLGELEMDWGKINANYKKKFQVPFYRNTWLEQQVLYSIAQRNIFKQVGRTMPSPYQCLHTTMACLNAADCRKAVELNSHGFAELIVTAESKCLMGLFLESRHAKKDALNYGQRFSTFDKTKSLIVILFHPICRLECKQATFFAQCAMHCGIKVVFAYDQQNIPSGRESSVITSIIHDQFMYLIQKGKMSVEELDKKKAELLSFCSVEELAEMCSHDEVVFIVDFLHTSRLVCTASEELVTESENFNCTSVKAALQSQKVKIVCVTSKAGVGCDNSEGDNDIVNIGTFYPLDRLTNMVEVFPSKTAQDSDGSSYMAALINAMGKMPINVGCEQLSMINLLLVMFWSRVAKHFSSAEYLTKSISEKDKIIGFSPGPFQAMDQVGLPYVLGLAQQANSSGHDCHHLIQLLGPLVAAGNTGKQIGNGFYAWRNGKPRLGKVHDVPKENTVGRHLALLAALEATKKAPQLAKCHIDLMCVSSPMWFPPQEGGPFHFYYRNPNLFGLQDSYNPVTKGEADLAYSDSLSIHEVQSMEPCCGMIPLPKMVPGASPNALFVISVIIVMFALMFALL